MLKRFKKMVFFLNKYKFFPPPYYTDLSGYEVLMDSILKYKLYQLDGDFVEIGVFLGGGTYKLSKLIGRVNRAKRIFAVDIFDPDFDKTFCAQGVTMKDIYLKLLNGESQYEIYKQVTKNCKNLVTIIGDSKKIDIPCEKIVFSYIDGNHSPDYVKNDFYKVWEKVVSGGVVVFDDYGYDLPQVTETIDVLIENEKQGVMKYWVVGLKTIFIQKK
jgi:hypothetical protein